MAESILSQADKSQAQEAARRPFFELNARYEIAPGAKLSALALDALCLLEGGIGAFEDDAADDLTGRQWAGIYCLRQAKAILEAMERMVYAAEVTAREAA